MYMGVVPSHFMSYPVPKGTFVVPGVAFMLLVSTLLEMELVMSRAAGFTGLKVIRRRAHRVRCPLVLSNPQLPGELT